MYDDSGIDDETLTQLANKIENDALFENGELDDKTLSQFVSYYDISFDMGVDDFFADIFSITSPQSSASNNTAQSRFASTTSEADLNTLIQETKSNNTVNNTKWAMKLFNEWRMCRNAEISNQSMWIPQLELMNADQMNTYLSHFIVEVRKADGQDYPAKFPYAIMTGILRHLRDTGKQFNFLDEKDFRFSTLR
jgi:hypothetical protein